ncbi:hypothetical protein AcW2_001380 [Taiwanofungus camphoratus]|nr:hypothetical protein AcW2_001380 [Antrodia cinnamomea]
MRSHLHTPKKALQRPIDLEEPISHTFQNGDPAWIKTEEGEWFQCTTGGIARVKVPPDSVSTFRCRSA